MHQEDKTSQIDIDLLELIRKLYQNKYFILKLVCISSILGIIISFSIPSKYCVKITISPETGQTGENGNLTGMASVLGLGGFGTFGKDAINSNMFPDIIQTTPFIIDIYNIKVSPQNQEKEIPLHKYLDKQKIPWWNYILNLPSNIKQLFSSKQLSKTSDESNINPYKLTNKQNGTIAAIRNSISAAVDNKTNMIIVSATFQDPEVAAIVADSTVAKLQEYIIDYRTRKAQEDCNYLDKLCKERKEEYHKAQQAYADFMDTNRNVILQRTQAEGTRLQNDMSIAFQIYSQVETQLQVARAKVQEAKPVFAIVEPATVPLSPSSPNKKVLVLIFIFLGFVGSSSWILFGKNIWKNLKNINKAQ